MKLPRTKLPEEIAVATHDRWGRLVLLPHAAMAHVAKRHPELDGCEMAISTAIETAAFRTQSTRGREVLYAANLGPAAWLAVVVAYDKKRLGRVITAYGSKKGPSGGQIWE